MNCQASSFLKLLYFEVLVMMKVENTIKLNLLFIFHRIMEWLGLDQALKVI